MLLPIAIAIVISLSNHYHAIVMLFAYYYHIIINYQQFLLNIMIIYLIWFHLLPIRDIKWRCSSKSMCPQTASANGARPNNFHRGTTCEVHWAWKRPAMHSLLLALPYGIPQNAIMRWKRKQCCSDWAWQTTSFRLSMAMPSSENAQSINFNIISYLGWPFYLFYHILSTQWIILH